MKTTLPTDSKERKEFPVFSGCLKYFPAALAGVANLSKIGNDKHAPGQELHHARGKSTDHTDCLVRHLMDASDMLAALERGEEVNQKQLLLEASSVAWRALAFSQELHEKFGAPIAPGAKYPEKSDHQKHLEIAVKNMTEEEKEDIKKIVEMHRLAADESVMTVEQKELYKVREDLDRAFHGVLGTGKYLK